MQRDFEVWLWYGGVGTLVRGSFMSKEEAQEHADYLNDGSYPFHYSIKESDGSISEVR